MRIKKIFIFLSSFLIFSLNTIEKTEAGLKDEYKKTSDIDFRTCEYDEVNMDKYSLKTRYCIRGKKVFSVQTGTSCVGSICMDLPEIGRSTLLKGKIGKSETYTVNNKSWEGNYLSTTSYLAEWDIEGNNLVKYRCATEQFSGKCSSQAKKEIMGTHRSITNPGLYINDIGNYFQRKGNYDKAMEWYKKAIDMKQELDSGWVAAAYTNIGVLKKNHLGNMSGACSEFRKASDLYPLSLISGLIKEACQ